MQAIQLAPKVLALVGEVQLVMGLYEAISGVLKGDRSEIYKTILSIIRSRLTPSQCSTIISYMQTAVTAIEFADKVKDVLSMIVDQYNSSTSSKELDIEYNEDEVINQILAIADRAVSESYHT